MMLNTLSGTIESLYFWLQCLAHCDSFPFPFEGFGNTRVIEAEEQPARLRRAYYSNPHWRDGHATLLGKKGTKTSRLHPAGAPQAWKGGEAWA